MSNSLPLQIAETIQATHINRSPSPRHDINPSTAASVKIPVTISAPDQVAQHDDTLGSSDEDDEIPVDVIRPLQRGRHVQHHFPPIPDMRFEQAYLASIKNADSTWKVVGITIKDQILLPLLQGTILSLLTLGWRHWNRTAQISGSGLGARIRRWWYRTNNWAIPGESDTMGAKKLAKKMGDFYKHQSVGD